MTEVLSGQSAGPAGLTDEAKATARAWIDANMDRLSQWHRHIWELAEPAWREFQSAAWYVERLRSEGFTVEAGSGGMPTAFAAEWSSGQGGPVLLTYAEYDAVPGNCQAAGHQEEPRDGLSEFAPGHTDPHSALGISTLAGLLATKHAMEVHGITGTLKYTGEPAEKVQGSKVVHGLRGYYDGVDAIVSFHPFYMLPLCNTARWDTQCGSYYSKVYTFVCDQPETWQLSANPNSPIPASHSAARAPGANVALMSMYSSSRIMQDAMLPSFGGWSLSDAIFTHGQATADNLPARIAQIQYSWRCPTVEMAEHVLTVLDRNAEHAAAMAHCRLETTWVARNRPGRTNHVLAQALYDNLEAVGAPSYGPDAVAAAQNIQQNLGLEPMDKPFLDECEQLITPQDAEAALREHMAPWQKNWTSDDYVEMTHYAPTVRFYVSRSALKPAPGQGAYPGWVMNALGGIPETIDPTIETAGKTITGTFIDLLTRPDVLAQARTEFEGRMAEDPMPALLEPDFMPPTELAWPDYSKDTSGSRVWHPNSI
ncbi:peptidase M20 [Arthrobacter crystallopoietes]|uniref:Aminobenzoyl-glutamate utilization protein B n=1 Tax=Crystallibacter crystallopoietes TaxID=37928 RepID=A0A1H0ZMQ7_9MICC|nr:peptidase M20 [Arthrobacter crystallopoietes]AUI51904.1 peptidase M20 [Arthrobacter crystallopoietes]SDQ28609.1 aminobenzoyl-glutamate utilization protein B [Arthrobacter crystallopoietes]